MAFVNIPRPGTLRIHKVDENGDSVGTACFEITGPGEFVEGWCDADLDGLDDGELELTDLVPGTYVVTEFGAPRASSATRRRTMS